MNLAIEKLADIWDELIPLARRHWAETEGYHRGQEFNPSLDRYKPYNEAGHYLMFTAREDGRLIGYIGVYLTRSMHSQELIVTEDTWYVAPEYRKGRNAIHLFRFAENECIRRGAVEIVLSVKLSNPTARKLLGHLGYAETGSVMTKQLHAPALKESA